MKKRVRCCSAWIFCRKPPPKNTPATALIQLEFLFIDGIQYWIQRRQPIFSLNRNPINLQYLKRGGGVFLKSHIFALVAGAFYKGSQRFITMTAIRSITGFLLFFAKQRVQQLFCIFFNVWQKTLMIL